MFCFYFSCIVLSWSVCRWNVRSRPNNTKHTLETGSSAHHMPIFAACLTNSNNFDTWSQILHLHRHEGDSSSSIHFTQYVQFCSGGGVLSLHEPITSSQRSHYGNGNSSLCLCSGQRMKGSHLKCHRRPSSRIPLQRERENLPRGRQCGYTHTGESRDASSSSRVFREEKSDAP